MKTKLLMPIGIALLWAARNGFAAEPEGRENRFDALAKMLAPFVALATPAGSAGNHALQAQAVIADVASLPETVKGAQISVAFEFPDKLRLQFPLGDTTATICRNGQTVWAFPAAQFAPLLARAGGKSSDKPLPEFRVDEKAAVLLPAFLDVQDAGFVALQNERYRVLDVRLAAGLSSKDTSGWSARFWMRPESHQPAQIALRTHDFSVTLLVQKTDFAPALAAETWKPAPEQEAQVLAIPGNKMAALIELALKQPR